MWKWVVAGALVGFVVLTQRQVTAPSRRRKKAVLDKLRRAEELVRATPENPAAEVSGA